MKSCGIKFEHTFAIVDFGQDPSYEVILGRPFMHQMMALKEWGYDYLYLRHEDVTTHVNLKDHTFRDVTQTPVEEFESATSITHLVHTQTLPVSRTLGYFKCQAKVYWMRVKKKLTSSSRLKSIFLYLFLRTTLIPYTGCILYRL